MRVFKRKCLKIGIFLSAIVGMLPLTHGVAQAQIVSPCINGVITVNFPGQPTMTFPCGTAGTGGTAQPVGRGFIEICKETQPAAPAGTFFSFSVPGVGTVNVPSGACSPPISVAAGNLTITEAARDGYVLCGVRTEPSGRFVGSNFPARTGTVQVVAGDVSTQTIVTFRNCEVGRLKLCKVAGNAIPIGRPFSMTVTPVNPPGPSVTYSVPAGPAPGGFCILDGIFAVGTDVRITDDLSRFFLFRNDAFSVLPANRITPPGYQPENDGAITPAAVTVRIGPGVTEVSFTNSCTFPGAPNCQGGFLTT